MSRSFQARRFAEGAHSAAPRQRLIAAVQYKIGFKDENLRAFGPSES
ncbi:MAG TPA: hypothetical protein VEG34_10755 [Thermoanaerobaculia bacterium]|nr:hypothetical protein [Thermoanaerobaculia bacterium]